MSTRRKTRIPDPSPPRLSRSPARSRKSSPARKTSPVRQIAPKPKSPARKSPSRKLTSKYPARKSPARTVRENIEPAVPEKKLSYPKSPGKRPALKSDIDAPRPDNISTIYRSTRSQQRTNYTVQDIFPQRDYTPEKNEKTDVFGLRNRNAIEEVPLTPRRSSRLREFIDVVPSLPDFRRSVSKSVSKHSRTPSESVSKSLGNYSDEENSVDDNYKEKLQTNRKLSTPLRTSISNINLVARQWEFGGRVGTAALIVLIPLTLISILTSCMKSCSFHTLLNFSPFKSLSLWFSVPTSIFIVAQIFLQAVMAIIPYFGLKTDGMDRTGKKHCFNALMSSIIAVNLVYQLDYWKLINKDILLQEYLKLATASYIFALALSITLYLKSKKLDKDEMNQYANTGYFLYDFFLGRDIHPCFKSLDVKIWTSRICNINTLILSLLIFTRSFKIEWTGTEDITLNIDHLSQVQYELKNLSVAVFSMMQIIYTLNFIVKEYRVTSTFYWHSEGVGYLQIVSSALYPFYFTSLSKHISDSDLTFSPNVLIVASLLYLLGYCLMLASNDIKYEFRRNPLQPSLAYLESMITFNGNKLITSHLWGILRHPNYSGDILIHLALALPGLVTGEIIAASPALITILVLLHRAWRDDARCQRRYGSAWTRYCKKVPSVIIPKLL